MDLGCPLLRGSSDRRLRRYAATEPQFFKGSQEQEPGNQDSTWKTKTKNSCVAEKVALFQKSRSHTSKTLLRRNPAHLKLTR